MPTPPNRLQVGTSFEQAIPLINDNFDKVIQDIRDLAASNTTTLGLAITVPANSLISAVVTVTSKGVTSLSANQVFTQAPVAALSGLSPQLDIFVDIDNDPNKLFPFGSSLTAGQLALFPIVTTLNTGFANSVGAYLIQLNNRDSVSHTYYLKTLAGYFPLPATGQFR